MPNPTDKQDELLLTDKEIMEATGAPIVLSGHRRLITKTAEIVRADTLKEEKKKWRYLASGVVEAIRWATQRWYADCYNTEGDIKRLMLWEMKIRQALFDKGEALKKGEK